MTFLNGNGIQTIPNDETRQARFPHLNPLPHAVEEANELLRELYIFDFIVAIEYRDTGTAARSPQPCSDHIPISCSSA